MRSSAQTFAAAAARRLAASAAGSGRAPAAIVQGARCSLGRVSLPSLRLPDIPAGQSFPVYFPPCIGYIYHLCPRSQRGTVAGSCLEACPDGYEAAGPQSARSCEAATSPPPSVEPSPPPSSPPPPSRPPLPSTGPASCFDDRLNNGEESIDCGGSSCPPCGSRADVRLRVAGVRRLETRGEDALMGVISRLSGLDRRSVFLVHQQPSGPDHGMGRTLLQGGSPLACAVLGCCCATQGRLLCCIKPGEGVSTDVLIRMVGSSDAAVGKAVEALQGAEADGSLALEMENEGLQLVDGSFEILRVRSGAAATPSGSGCLFSCFTSHPCLACQRLAVWNQSTRHSGSSSSLA